MIQLRPEGNKDNAFIETLYYTTREAELNLTDWTKEQKNAFALMQSMAQLSEYKKKFPGAAFQVIIFKVLVSRDITLNNVKNFRFGFKTMPASGK